MKDSVKVDTRFEAPQEGDTILLCSDGLAGPVTDADILKIVDGTPDLSTATQELVKAANERGGPDNVTCVLARWIV
jgi:protein phosphatase